MGKCGHWFYHYINGHKHPFSQSSQSGTILYSFKFQHVHLPYMSSIGNHHLFLDICFENLPNCEPYYIGLRLFKNTDLLFHNEVLSFICFLFLGNRCGQCLSFRNELRREWRPCGKIHRRRRPPRAVIKRCFWQNCKRWSWQSLQKMYAWLLQERCFKIEVWEQANRSRGGPTRLQELVCPTQDLGQV